MFSSRSGLALPLVLGAAILSAGQSQAPNTEPPAPTFKSKVQVVLVDVTVTNSKGNPVFGLHRDAFHVREDGKPQTVSFFEEHTAARLTKAMLPPMPPDVYTNYPKIENADAVNVLLLDWLNTQPSDQAFVHAQIVRYLQHVPPGTPLAIFSMGARLRMIQGFTTDPQRLLATVDEKAASDLHVSRLLPSGAAELEDRNSIALMRMNQAAGPAIAARRDLLENVSVSDIDGRMTLTLLEIQQLARYLAGVPGRKNVIWFAGAFPIGAFPSASTPHQYQREIDENAVLLNNNRVAIYPVSAAGLEGLAAFEAGNTGPVAQAIRGQYEGTAARQIAMAELAKESGGSAFMNTNDLSEAISHAVSEGDHYYTLTYTPTNKEANGKYRRIDVRVDGEYKLSYRRGYYTEDAKRAALIAATPYDSLLPLMEFGLPEAAQIVYKVRVQPSNPQPAPGAPLLGSNSQLKAPLTRYRVEFAITESDLRLKLNPDGSRRGDIELMVVAYDRDGKPLNLMVHRTGLLLKPDTYRLFQNVGLQMQSEIDVPKGAVILQTGVLDLQSNLAGTLEAPINEAVANSTAQPTLRQ